MIDDTNLKKNATVLVSTNMKLQYTAYTEFDRAAKHSKKSIGKLFPIHSRK